MKAAEGAFSHYEFQSGYDGTDKGVWDASFYFVKTSLNKIAFYGISDDTFKCKIEKRTKSFTFIITFTSRALASSFFVRTVVKFIRDKIEKESSNVDCVGKKLELLLSSPSTSSSDRDLSVDVKLRQCATDKNKKTDKPHDGV